ncbi:MAG: hypothetical protein K2L59_09875 [Muribaculaceae bacterium]|nr:hypothetical protein [Muribaculaceae bacterium]
MNIRSLKTIVIAAMAAICPLRAAAVTDKEMEEARTITAKAYLRYANDGSGYLDDVTATTMTALNASLKAKEKENLKAFNSVKVPSDYASWDKEKLVEFWAVTFFTSPALSDKGKVAKSRVRKQISAMNIAAPATKEEAKKEEAKADAPAPAKESPEITAQDNPVSAETGSESMTADAAQAQEDLLSDQNAIEKDAADAAPERPQEESHTWVYVLVLAILVGIVIWLVVYAANLMKRQPDGGNTEESGDTADLREQTRKAIAAKNKEIEDLHLRLQAEESKSADLGMELERARLDRNRLEETLSRLREENAALTRKLAGNATARTATAATVRANETAAPARRENTREDAPEQKPILRVIYLGRANARGIFVRADRRINAGNTIYRLDTNDGLVGTFHVVDEPEVVDVALSNPAEYLGNGCTGEDLADTTGVTRIVTESAGTAIFENGYWKILRKTRIRYE